MARVTIDPRYCGPPGSGNGGYTCGLTAQVLGPGPCEVTLTSPPPLGRALDLQARDEEARLTDAGTVVALARRCRLELDLPPAPTYEHARSAAAAFDLARYRRTHAYPTCFTCGPDRDPGDGLGVFAAPAAGPVPYIWPWVPQESYGGTDGRVDERIVWAALDCPGAHAWIHSEPSLTGIVLGRMAAEVRARPSAGDRTVVGAWTLDRQGRKLHSAAALWSESGEALAWSRTTWIVLTEEQRAAFGSALAANPD